jgi:O-antigen/teichoic acid export membrane protein
MKNRHMLSQWAKHVIGLDRAIIFTVLARLLQIVSSVGTVLLIVHFLSDVEQGYYYTLLSLVALQIVFELGFSFVVLQLAAHETAHLTIYLDGRIEGSSVVQARLASVLKLTVRWYSRAAVVLVVILLPVGIVFFSRKTQAEANVTWLGPWVSAVLAVSISFLLTPLYSFLEGCNKIQQVAKVRMYQALMVLVISWSTIMSGHGLYACAMVNSGTILVGGVYLIKQRQLLLRLLRYPVGDNAVSWRQEVWPFQWKSAVSWFCSYFTLQIFVPILFTNRGPVEAGKLGVSLSVVGYLPIVALCWITTKAVTFGRLVELGRVKDLNALFFRTLKQAFVLIVILAVGCLSAIICAQHILPAIAKRMETPVVFALLLLAAISSFIVQGLAIYLRSFKKEPYLVQSLITAILTLVGALLVVPRWGSIAIAALYFLISGVVGLLWAIAIFRTNRETKNRIIESKSAVPAFSIADSQKASS